MDRFTNNIRGALQSAREKQIQGRLGTSEFRTIVCFIEMQLAMIERAGAGVVELPVLTMAEVVEQGRQGETQFAVIQGGKPS